MIQKFELPRFKDKLKIVKQELNSNKFFYLLLSSVIVLSLFLRTYRLHDLLGFYYDQGRDALVIWRLWHEGKLFLIGPVTGLHGIFLGPFYYYLVAPFYILGAGNPVVPAAFLALTTVLGLIVLYVIGLKMHSRFVGLLAVIVGGFSYYLVLAGRWLSNPTPIFLTSSLLLLCMWNLVSLKSITPYAEKVKSEKLKYLWILIALLIGLSLQLESASAVFYLPMIIVFAIWNCYEKAKSKNKKIRNLLTEILHFVQNDKKYLMLGIFVLFVTFLPQILFDFRHDHIILNNLKRELVEEKSFRNPLSYENLSIKANYFKTVFTSKVFPTTFPFYWAFYILSFFGLVKLCSTHKKQILLLLIFLGSPLVGGTLFQGNSGNFYDYYMTGYYFPMILLFSLGLGVWWNNLFGKLVISFFIAVFLYINGTLLKNYLSSPIGGPDGVALGNELQAVDWIFNNAKNNDVYMFNVDVYVPPIIPHSYDYLFLWQGTNKCGESLCGLTTDKKTNVLYTLYEEDKPHPERLGVWLIRQEGIGNVLESQIYSSITVERRVRI